MPKKKAARSRGRPTKKPSPKGKKPRLTDKQWLALERERGGCREGYKKDGWPSKTAAEIVGRAAGVSRKMVHQWRTDPKYRHEYRRGLDWLLIEELTQRLDQSGQTADADTDTDDPNSTEFRWVKYDPD